LNDYACGGGPVQEEFVALPSVRIALNVPVRANFFSGDNGVGMVYNTTERNVMGIYQAVANETKWRMMVYNGDTDPGINSFVAQNWTEHLGFEVKQSWRGWTLDR